MGEECEAVFVHKHRLAEQMVIRLKMLTIVRVRQDSNILTHTHTHTHTHMQYSHHQIILGVRLK